jgi:lysophospholipase L1-like esterase
MTSESPVAVLRSTKQQAFLTAGLIGSIVLLPIAMVQGAATRRRVPTLPPARAPLSGRVPGVGKPIRILAIGESSVCGVGVARGDETVAAIAARALGRGTKRPVVWHSFGLSGATARDAQKHLIPCIGPEPVDLVFVAFGVNDATSYRSPRAFANDLVALVTTVRNRVGDAAVIIAGIAPLNSFPALPWPLRAILGWRSSALQAAVESLPKRLTRLVVERFGVSFTSDLFADDKFHPNSRAHKLWGEEIGALAIPLINSCH